MVKVAVSDNVARLATSVIHLCDGCVSVQSTSIGVPGGGVYESVHIAAGVMVAQGACEQKKENRVYGEWSESLV